LSNLSVSTIFAMDCN